MKALLVKYKSVLKFILTFLSVYLVLTLAYKFYLDWSDGSEYYPDYISNLVSNQTKVLLDAFGYDTELIAHPDELSMKLIIENTYVAKIVEGCNSVSVIILFVSFIVAFAGDFKPTVLYMFSGSVLIYAVNVLRIALIAIALYEYPWRRDILHSVVFPMIIYGMVFLLWMFWINRFTKQNKLNA